MLAAPAGTLHYRVPHHSRSPSAGWAVSAPFRAAHGREGKSGPQPPLGVSGECYVRWLRGRACLVELPVGV